MKDLVLSTLIVALLVGCWFIFDNYSSEATNGLSSIITEDIIPLAEEKKWDDAARLYSELEDEWNKYKKVALSFLENEQINEIDLCIARAEKYIEAKDVSNSVGELCSISKQLLLLDSREKITISNIL